MYASCKRNLKSKNFCFLDLNLACFGVRGPPWKIFKEKIWTCENKSCSTIISEQLCQKTFFSHLLTFRDNGGPQFPAKMHQFWDFGPQGGPGEVWKPQKWRRHGQKPPFWPLIRLHRPYIHDMVHGVIRYLSPPVPPSLKKILLCKNKNYVTPCKVSEGVKTCWNMLI